MYGDKEPRKRLWKQSKMELLNSRNEISDEDERRLDEMFGEMKNPEIAAEAIRQYQGILNMVNSLSNVRNQRSF